MTDHELLTQIARDTHIMLGVQLTIMVLWVLLLALWILRGYDET